MAFGRLSNVQYVYFRDVSIGSVEAGAFGMFPLNTLSTNVLSAHDKHYLLLYAREGPNQNDEW